MYLKKMLPCSKNIFADEEVIKNILKIYNTILGEKRIKENCKIIN